MTRKIYLKSMKSISVLKKRGRKGSTGVMRIRWHVVDPSPRKKAEKNTNANNELAIAA
jgi:hypothetical protein